MPPVPARVAAKLAGRDRSTILRAIETGRLSAEKTPQGYLIDPAELERVFGPLRAPDADAEADAAAFPMRALQDAAARAALEKEVSLLREMLERERRQWDEERTFLRHLLDKETDQVRLLTDERQQQDRERERSRSRLPFLARLFGHA